MFWSDWGRKPKIETAWMDGQHREVLLDEDLGWPTGLALDYLNENRIYWCDSKENIIESMKADGTDRQIIISGGETSEKYIQKQLLIGRCSHVCCYYRHRSPLQSGCVRGTRVLDD